MRNKPVPRKIITAKYLVESFGQKLDLKMLLGILAPFSMPLEAANDYFDDYIESAEIWPDDPGKRGAIEIWKHLKSALNKMSAVERKRVADELPGEIALWVKKHGGGPAAPRGRPRKFDDAKALELRSQGLSLSAIAKQLGVSRSAVQHAIRRAEK